MTHYIIATDPQRMGQLHTFSAGKLFDVLGVASVYFQLEDYCDEESMAKVMIRYD